MRFYGAGRHGESKEMYSGVDPVSKYDILNAPVSKNSEVGYNGITIV